MSRGCDRIDDATACPLTSADTACLATAGPQMSAPGATVPTMTVPPVTAPLAFIDTETTSLRPDRKAWEVGLVLREPGRDDAEHRWLIRAADLDLGNADPAALRVGRFYDRHPEYGGPDDPVWAEAVALREIERLTRGAHLVGAVVSFDADVLGTRMRASGICPSWHYHLIDVEPLVVGYLSAYERRGRLLTAKIGLPWKSDDLSKGLGVRVSDDDRHTALGDARWAMRLWDAVMAPAA